ncbi:MAG: hypothetical protein FWE82_07260 [Defluviitaleaceae bacterium]|nr:hypothetical protein [Defluviitaleaceae bacterium]
MERLTFTVNGINFLPFTAEGGIVIKRNDVDSSDAGEMLDGTLRRARIIMRRTIEVKTRALYTDEIKAVLAAVWPQFFPVEFLDPFEGGVITREFYVSTVPATVSRLKNGKVYWDAVSITMIEQGVPFA